MPESGEGQSASEMDGGFGRLRDLEEKNRFLLGEIEALRARVRQLEEKLLSPSERTERPLAPCESKDERHDGFPHFE